MARHPLRYAFGQLLLQFRIVSALARREMDIRAAKGLFGVVGVFLEPLALVGTFMALRILIRGAGEGSYMNLVLWLSAGFVPFFLFAEVAIKAISGVQKNSTLYFYRRLRPLDSLMGNALLTVQIFGLLLLVICLGVTAWEWRWQVGDLGSAIFLVLGIAVLGFGVGLATLILGHRLPALAWFVKLFLRRILLWTSCVFFPIRILPDQFRPWVLWNPMSHGIELLRHACSPSYPIPGVSPLYFWAWVIGSTGFGLFIYNNNEDLLYSAESLPLPGDDVDDV